MLLWGQFGFEGLYDLVVVDEVVAVDVAEDLQDAFGAGGGAIAELGVEGDTGGGLGSSSRCGSRVR